MYLKQIILVVIVSSIIGALIFWSGFLSQKPTATSTQNKLHQLSKNIMMEKTPTPSPTLPPIDETTNLTEEINKLTPPDFAGDFNSLRNLNN